MTNEQILNYAKEYFEYYEDEWRAVDWGATTENLLKFALAIHENGYNAGLDEGLECFSNYEMNSND